MKVRTIRRMSLTENQAAVLAFIKQHAKVLGSTPTRGEICMRFKWKSINSAEQVVRRLAALGYVELVKPGKTGFYTQKRQRLTRNIRVLA